jgi:hypothetical protein
MAPTGAAKWRSFAPELLKPLRIVSAFMFDHEEG